VSNARVEPRAFGFGWHRSALLETLVPTHDLVAPDIEQRFILFHVRKQLAEIHDANFLSIAHDDALTKEWPQRSIERGAFTLFSPGMSNYVQGTCINDRDDVAGTYLDASHLQHGYIRRGDGSVDFFSAPDGGTTTPVAINNKRVIAGNDGDRVSHGFIRGRGGKITTFDVPRAKSTNVSALSNHNLIAGTYITGIDDTHGYLRQADGTIVTFDPPRSTDTVVTGLNDDGIVVGYYDDNNGRHGFARSLSGTFATLDAPASLNAPGRIDHECGGRTARWSETISIPRPTRSASFA